MALVLPFQKESRRHKLKQKHKDRTRHSERSDGRYTGDLHQCLGPTCIALARPNSKYCSEDCGMKLAAKWVLCSIFVYVSLAHFGVMWKLHLEMMKRKTKM